MLYSFIFQILNSSQRLMGGETLPCPNSMCKERFTSGFEEMKRFMDHTIANHFIFVPTVINNVQADLV